MSTLRSRLVNRYRDLPLPETRSVRETSLSDRHEMPRFPIRLRLGLFAALVAIACLLTAILFVNPVAPVCDVRLATKYNELPLTSVAVEPSGEAVWIGSDGGGIKIFRPGSFFFDRDIRHVADQQGILSDHVVDLAIGSGRDAFAAVVTSSEASAGQALRGLQIVSVEKKWDRWPPPVVDMNSFPGLDDSTASCVAATPDGNVLVVGTRGFGLGFYVTDNHSWAEVVTSSQGLLSDTVHDLKVSAAPVAGEPAMLYVATEKGLVAGSVRSNGGFDLQLQLTAEDGLAGNDLRSLNLVGNSLWYRTAGKGLGRLHLDSRGMLQAENASQVLVSESRLPGLDDADIVTAGGSPNVPVTWFVAMIEGNTHVGRYRELPHDTVGVEASKELPDAQVGAVVVEPLTGRRALFGTSNGAWFFTDKETTDRGEVEGISGVYAGPGNSEVSEVALFRSRAIIKSVAASGRPVLLQAPLADESPWVWDPIVGDGRFTGLRSLADLTCIAALDTESPVFIGTREHGIGLWDRSRMELRRERHSSNSSPSLTLRHNQSLDLAVSGGMLVQVTGDRAVDVYHDDVQFPLVPASSAPLDPDTFTAVAARDLWFACAGQEGVAVYDRDAFAWRHEMLTDVEQLEISGSRIWARLRSGDLYSGLLTGNGAWDHVATHVRRISVSAAAAFLLLAEPNQPASVHVLSADTAEEAFAITPGPLETHTGTWRFAAGFNDDLILVSDESFDRYRFDQRRWEHATFPDSVQPPLAIGRQNQNGFWLVDSKHAVHRLAVDGSNRINSIDSAAEYLSVNGDSAAVLKSDVSDDSRLVIHEGEEPISRTVVGRSFDGDLAAVIDAVEWNGLLAVIANDRIGFYSWQTHDWETILAPFEGLERLHVNGAVLWIETSEEESSGLLFWDKGEFIPVEFKGERVAATKLVEASDALWLLDREGRVLRCDPSNPSVASEAIAASRFAGTVPIRPSSTTVIDGQLTVLSAGQLHRFVEGTGPGRWTSLPGVPEGVSRVVDSPSGSTLAVAIGSEAFLIRPQSDRIFTIRITPDQFAGQVKDLVAVDDFAACATVETGENTLRVRTADSGSGEIRSLIGNALPPSGASRDVVEIPDSTGRILRLDEDGRLGVYDPRTRDWVAEAVGGQLSRLWVYRDQVIGLAENEGSMYVRPASGAWKKDDRFTARVTDLSVFPEAVLAKLEEGSWWWFRSFDDQPVAVGQTSVSPDCPGPDFSQIAHAVQVGDDLVLVDTRGDVAVFRWESQKWIPFEGGKVESLEYHDGQLFFYGDGVLMGPVVSGQNALMALPQPAELRQLIRHQGRLMGVSVEGAFYEFADGNRKWSKIGGEMAAASREAVESSGSLPQDTPLRSLGDVRQVHELAGYLMVVDEVGKMAAFHRSSGRWVSRQGFGSVQSVATLGSALFLVVDDLLAGPVEIDPEQPFHLTAPVVELPGGLRVDQIVAEGDTIVYQTRNGHLFSQSAEGGKIPWFGPLRQAEAAPRLAKVAPCPVEEIPVPTPLRDWKVVDPENRIVERRFADGEFSPVRLLESGFDFEQVHGVEIEGEHLLVHSPAGQVKKRLYEGDPVPMSLAPSIKLPADGIDGTVRLVDGDRLLFKKGDTAPYWILKGAGWEPTSEDYVTRFATAPLLAGRRWTWERPGADGESVTYAPEGGNPINSFFDPVEGRFAWDACLGIGQASGVPWVLTKAGMFRLFADQIGALPQAVPGGVDRRVSFLEVTGRAPGVLLRDGSAILIDRAGKWAAPTQADGVVVSGLLEYRAAEGSWKVPRDDGREVERLQPQDPNVSASVAIGPDGKWDFETVNDILALDLSCALVSRFGYGELNKPEYKWSKLIPFEDGFDRLFLLNDRPLAESATGRLFDLGTEGFMETNSGPGSRVLPQIREGSRYRTTRNGGALTIEVKRSREDGFREADTVGGRFAFDALAEVELGDGGVVFAYTSEGLVEFHPDGGVKNIEIQHVDPNVSLDLFACMGSDGVWMPHATDGSHYLKYDGEWQSVSAEDGEEALRRAEIDVLQNERWRIGRGGESAIIEISMHADEDSADTYKSVSFDHGDRMFDFDMITAVVPSGDGSSILIGTESGTQRVTLAQRRLTRLWREPSRDGIGAERINGLVAGPDGRIEASTAAGYFSLSDAAQVFKESNAAAYQDALGLRASDPSGWSVRFQPGAGQLALKLADETVRLQLDQNAGGIRFAHNIVNAVESIQGGLVLATAGGLLFFDSATQQNRSNSRLMAAPFPTESGNSRHPEIRWLRMSPKKGFVRARGSDGAEWEIDVSNPSAASAVAPLDGEALADATKIAQDDILVWYQSDLGKVEVRFSPGKAAPSDLAPEMDGETFRFLHLTQADPQGGKHSTIAGIGADLFWATSSGIVRYDTTSDQFVRIDAAADKSATTMGSLDEVFLHVKNHTVYARSGDAFFAFDPERQEWTKAGETEQIVRDRTIVSDSPMLEWRALNSGGVSIRLKTGDDEGRPFFVDGRPPVDEIYDVSIFRDSKQDIVALGTQGGVMEYQAADFSSLRSFRKDFEDESTRELRGVTQIAAINDDGGGLRRAARNESGEEFIYESGRWARGREVATGQIFEASYLRVDEPGNWKWSQFPAGLLCTLQATNGPPLRLGESVDQSFATLFRNGRMAKDNVGGVVVAGDEILAATPIGVVRYLVNRSSEASIETGVDCWIRSENGVSLRPIANIQGIISDGRSVTVWTDDQVFEQVIAQSRRWVKSPTSIENFYAERSLKHGDDEWVMELQRTDRRELRIGYLRDPDSVRDFYYLPHLNEKIDDVALSPYSLWILAGNQLYSVDRRRDLREPNNFSRWAKSFSGDDVTEVLSGTSSQP